MLGRHLVSKELRTKGGNGDGPNKPSSSKSTKSAAASLHSSSDEAQSKRSSQVVPAQREDSEPFPIPYDAPGADVT